MPKINQKYGRNRPNNCIERTEMAATYLHYIKSKRTLLRATHKTLLWMCVIDFYFNGCPVFCPFMRLFVGHYRSGVIIIASLIVSICF